MPDCLALAGVGDPVQAGARPETGFAARAATGSRAGGDGDIDRRTIYGGFCGWSGREPSRNRRNSAGSGYCGPPGFRADTAEAMKAGRLLD